MPETPDHHLDQPIQTPEQQRGEKLEKAVADPQNRETLQHGQERTGQRLDDMTKSLAQHPSAAEMANEPDNANAIALLQDIQRIEADANLSPEKRLTTLVDAFISFVKNIVAQAEKGIAAGDTPPEMKTNLQQQLTILKPLLTQLENLASHLKQQSPASIARQAQQDLVSASTSADQAASDAATQSTEYTQHIRNDPEEFQKLRSELRTFYKTWQPLKDLSQ